MSKLAGSELRDLIARTLRMKYQLVETEYRLECTTADVYYIDDTNPTFPRAIAIEAKDWKKPLTSADIAGIENLYRPSLASRDIEFLWIIGNHVLASQPADSIKRLRWVKYSTVEDFRLSMMNFSGILNDNILEYQQSGIDQNFIQTRIKDSEVTLYQYTMQWLETDSAGLIVYGGYGLGKTTFSLYLAHELSNAHNQGTFKRVPIRILLGRMFTKQDISGLICAALSGGEGRASVRDFSYNLFLEANSAGAYVLILDGFDEMKHAMTIDDFSYTFEQMKPLFRGKAKVILLGRPDSFISSSEEHQVLSTLFESPSAHDRSLTKVEIDFFTKDEIKLYLRHFADSRPELSQGQRRLRYDLLVNRLINEGDVLSRPVQLKMFTEIVDRVIDDDLVITRYELYRQFIYKFILRENRKEARQIPHPDGVPAEFNDDRAQFMMSMAWWVLAIKKENRFVAEEIPVNLVPRGIRFRRDSLTAAREAIVGSVIEPMDRSHVIDKKAQRFYFFPHKSYLEFLVAQYFVLMEMGREQFSPFYHSLNPEILSFIEEGPMSGIRKLRAGLRFLIHTVDFDIIRVCLLDDSIEKEIMESKIYNTASHIYVHYLFLQKNNPPAAAVYLRRKFSEVRSLEAAIATANCIHANLGASSNIEEANMFVSSLIVLLSPYNLSSLQYPGTTIELYNSDMLSLAGAIMRRCVTIAEGGDSIRIDLDKLHALIKEAAKGSFFVELPSAVKKDRIIRLNSSSIAGLLEPRIKGSFTCLLENGSATQPFSRIILRGEAEKRFGSR